MPGPQRFAWTDRLDQQLRDLATVGTSVRDMAAKVGTSKSVVDRRLKHLGIILDRTTTMAATQANLADAKARRAALQLRHLARAEHLFARLEAATFTTILRGAGASEHEATLAFVPTPNERDIALTIKAHEESSMRLDLHDSGASSEQVVGLLQRTATALGLTDHQDTQAPE